MWTRQSVKSVQIFISVIVRHVRTILGCLFKKQVTKVRTGFIWQKTENFSGSSA